MERRSHPSVWFVLWLAYFLLVAAPSAHAYIDPGVGSFVFQALIGGLLAVGLAFRSSWRRVWTRLRRRSQDEQAPDQAD